MVSASAGGGEMRAGNAHDAHDPPHLDCTCGAKTRACWSPGRFRKVGRSGLNEQFADAPTPIALKHYSYRAEVSIACPHHRLNGVRTLIRADPSNC